MAQKNKSSSREAVALEYSPDNAAPKIVAAGRGLVAERIISEAEAHNISIYEDPDLAHTLNMLNIGDTIPPELYQVVAQILIYVGDIDKLKGKTK